MDDKDVAEIWNKGAASWGSAVQGHLRKFRDAIRNPSVLNLLGDIRGHELMDLACGEDDGSRLLARQGAVVTGVDIAPRMIELARAEERRYPLSVKYIEASASDLSCFASKSFDDVVCLSLMNLGNLDAVMRECYRLLKDGGTLTFSTAHPCFFALPNRKILHDTGSNMPGIFVQQYFRDKPHFEKNEAPRSDTDAERFETVTFPYTLSTYLNAPINAGFVVTHVEEPRAAEESIKGDPLLAFWSRHAARYLMVQAQKPSAAPAL